MKQTRRHPPCAESKVCRTAEWCNNGVALLCPGRNGCIEELISVNLLASSVFLPHFHSSTAGLIGGSDNPLPPWYPSAPGLPLTSSSPHYHSLSVCLCICQFPFSYFLFHSPVSLPLSLHLSTCVCLPLVSSSLVSTPRLPTVSLCKYQRKHSFASSPLRLCRAPLPPCSFISMWVGADERQASPALPVGLISGWQSFRAGPDWWQSLSGLLNVIQG